MPAQACKDLTLAAASGKKVDVVRSIDLGAEVNATVNSYTPLMRAATWGHVGTLAALIEEGADLFSTDRRNRTALDWSRIARHDKAARMLERAMENEILHRRCLLCRTSGATLPLLDIFTVHMVGLALSII